MRLILLRHEQRGMDVSFYSSLTENGIIKACSTLPKKLKKMNIDVIFSSPFIRTLQTIYFYAHKNDVKVNLEYGLYEYLHNPYFLLGNWYYTKDDINDKDLISIVNQKYSSIVSKDDFSVLENEHDLEKRIIKFFSYLKENYNDKTVLLVTHKGVINKIKNVYIKKTDMEDHFDMGSIEVYEI